MDVLIHRKDIDILLTKQEFHFSDTDVIGAEQGLNIAVGFTAFDNNQEWILTPQYGELVFNSLSWGSHPNGTFYLERERLDTHRCTREELGLTNDTSNAVFMPFRETQKEFMDFYYSKLLCLSKEDMYINGEFNSKTARQLNVQLLKCTGRPDCKSEDEI